MVGGGRLELTSLFLSRTHDRIEFHFTPFHSIPFHSDPIQSIPFHSGTCNHRIGPERTGSEVITGSDLIFYWYMNIM